MGQTPSKNQQFADLYSSYIQQQQDLIYQQQQQINDLYKFNLESQQQMPSNMFFPPACPLLVQEYVFCPACPCF